MVGLGLLLLLFVDGVAAFTWKNAANQEGVAETAAARRLQDAACSCDAACTSSCDDDCTNGFCFSDCDGGCTESCDQTGAACLSNTGGGNVASVDSSLTGHATTGWSLAPGVNSWEVIALGAVEAYALVRGFFAQFAPASADLSGTDGPGCLNTCTSPVTGFTHAWRVNNGVCDDGSDDYLPGKDGRCEFGTDCADCGPVTLPPGPPPLPTPPPYQPLNRREESFIDKYGIHPDRCPDFKPGLRETALDSHVAPFRSAKGFWLTVGIGSLLWIPLTPVYYLLVTVPSFVRYFQLHRFADSPAEGPLGLPWGASWQATWETQLVCDLHPFLEARGLGGLIVLAENIAKWVALGDFFDFLVQAIASAVVLISTDWSAVITQLETFVLQELDAVAVALGYDSLDAFLNDVLYYVYG